jgi:hypothetical protein
MNSSVVLPTSDVPIASPSPQGNAINILACIVCVDNINLESLQHINHPQGFYTYIFKIYFELLILTVHCIT